MSELECCSEEQKSNPYNPTCYCPTHKDSVDCSDDYCDCNLEKYKNLDCCYCKLKPEDTTKCGC